MPANPAATRTLLGHPLFVKVVEAARSYALVESVVGWVDPGRVNKIAPASLDFTGLDGPTIGSSLT
jgi:hypothetical protein